MIRIAILLVGIGIGFAAARYLLPSSTDSHSHGETASCGTGTVQDANHPGTCTTATANAIPSASPAPQVSENEPVPRITVTIPEGGYAQQQTEPVGSLPTEETSVTDVFAKLGLKKGDIILRINEQFIYSPLEALTLLQALARVNAPVKEVLVRRSGQEIRISPPRS